MEKNCRPDHVYPNMNSNDASKSVEGPGHFAICAGAEGCEVSLAVCTLTLYKR